MRNTGITLIILSSSRHYRKGRRHRPRTPLVGGIIPPTLPSVASLPLLVENTYVPGPDCVELLASQTFLAEVRRDFFNGRTHYTQCP